MNKPLDELCINTLRFLAVDAVQKANSGHPGLPLGAAAMAYTLWDRFLRYSPHDPEWPNRDRFVLSAGHGSALLYALLHVTGFGLPLDEGSITGWVAARGKPLVVPDVDREPRYVRVMATETRSELAVPLVFGVFVLESGKARFVPLPGAQEGRPVAAPMLADRMIFVDGRHGLADGQAVQIKK